MNKPASFQLRSGHDALTASGDPLDTIHCAGGVRYREGIASFTTNQDYYFGEIPPADMLELVVAIERDGWEPAFEAMCAKQTVDLANYIRQYIADASRANWKYLLQLPPEATVLDFGCGWGETTLSLARSVNRVVSMDLTLERLLLLRARSQELGLSRISFAHGGDVLPLPFAEQSFDAVVLNGVLEWVPVTGQGNPRQCQLALLRELRRILKPTGQIYIGIENRIGLKYFLGRIDEHSRLKFTTLMPRWLANQWSRFRNQQAYRTYTYTRLGYRKLLREAGFDYADFYCPYPDYREFDRIVPAEPKCVRQLFKPRAAWKRLIFRLPGAAQVLISTVPSYAIVASIAKPGTSRLQAIVQQVSAQTGIELLAPASYHSKPIGEVMAYCSTDLESQSAALLRVADTPVAVTLRLAAARHLESFWERHAAVGPCLQVVPHNLGYGSVDNATFTVEEVKPGVAWQSICDFRKTPVKAMVTVVNWLIDFQLATRTNACWTNQEMQSRLVALVAEVQDIFARRRLAWNGLGQNSQRKIDTDSGQAIPVVVCHGDLHLGNTLFSPTDQRLTGVVDWDLGELRGLPLLDLTYLLLAYGMQIKQQSYCQTLQSILQPSRLSEFERQALRDYETAFALTESYRRYALQVMVLQNIITLFARRPEAFQQLEKELMVLPAWLDQHCQTGGKSTTT